MLIRIFFYWNVLGCHDEISFYKNILNKMFIVVNLVIFGTGRNELMFIQKRDLLESSVY